MRRPEAAPSYAVDVPLRPIVSSPGANGAEPWRGLPRPTWRQLMNPVFRFRTRTLSALAVAALAGALAGPAFAADKTTAAADARYLKERADCEAGRTAEDRATCLKEAGAAQAERKRHQLDNSGSPAANAAERCNALPAKDRADCLARVQGPVSPNQRVTTSGSVAGGGVLKETTTTTPGPIVVIMPPAPNASSATQ